MIKPPNSGTSTANQTQDYELGSGAVLAMSNRVQVDGVWLTMASGYPKLSVQGSKDIFTVRLPKGAGGGTRISYDPTINQDQVWAVSNTATASVMRTVNAVLHTIFLCYILG